MIKLKISFSLDTTDDNPTSDLLRHKLRQARETFRLVEDISSEPWAKAYNRIFCDNNFTMDDIKDMSYALKVIMAKREDLAAEIIQISGSEQAIKAKKYWLDAIEANLNQIVITSEFFLEIAKECNNVLQGKFR